MTDAGSACDATGIYLGGVTDRTMRPHRIIGAPMLLGWVTKRLVTALGGMRLSQRPRPAFGGMVHGDSLIAAFWLLNDALTGTVGHWIFPGAGQEERVRKPCAFRIIW
jgi:hypothetical protein